MYIPSRPRYRREGEKALDLDLRGGIGRQPEEIPCDETRPHGVSRSRVRIKAIHFFCKLQILFFLQIANFVFFANL